jgi:HK97 gp10 family phage protein
VPYKHYSATHVNSQIIELETARLVGVIHDIAERVASQTAFRVRTGARRKAPVRKVFKGGRATIGFGRSGFRARGLDDEQLARNGAQRRKYTRPPRSASPLPAAPGRPRYGVVTRVNRANSAHSPESYLRRVVHTGGLSRLMDLAGKPPPAISEIKAALASGARTGGAFHLENRAAEATLSARGRYELKSGRAVHGATPGSRSGFQLGGALRDSIDVVDGGSTETRIAFDVVAGGPAAPYARYVEFGTRHAAAQPFLRPALAEERASRRLVTDLHAELKKLEKK